MTSTALAIIAAALPASAIIWAVRRYLAPLPTRIVIASVVVSFALVANGFVPGRLPLPVDEVARGYPFKGLFHVERAANSLTNDTVYQMLPWMAAAREQLFSGHAPLWNPYSFSGYPLLANGQSAPFGPFFLLTLIASLPKQIVSMAFLKLLVSFIFTYLFLKDDDLSDGAAILGAVTYTLSVFNTVYLYYPLTSVTSLLPLLLWSARRCLQMPGLRWAGVLALATAAALAGGHPESALHLALACGAFVIGESIAIRAGISTVARVVAAAIYGAIVSAPAWVPIVPQILASERFSHIRAAGNVSHQYPGMIAWLLLSPNGFGTPARHSWNWIMNYSMAAPTYVGLLPLALLPIALLQSRVRGRVYALVAIGTFLLALDWTPVAHWLNRIPPFAYTANDRLRFIAVFFCAAAAAHAADRLTGRLLLPFAATCIAIAAACAWLFTKRWDIAFRPRDTVGAIALAAVLALLFRAKENSTRLPWLLAACTALDLITLNTEFNRGTKEQYFRPTLPIINALNAIRPAGPFRILGFDWDLLPNQSTLYGLEDIRGSDPMAPAAYTKFLGTLASDDSANEVRRIKDVDQPGIAFLGVQFVLTDPSIHLGDHWRLRYRGPDGNLYESTTALPRFFAPPSDRPSRPIITSIRQTEPRKYVLTVSSDGEGFVASSVPLAPGWRVYVGGRRTQLHIVNQAFIGFLVPQGRSEVIVVYRPLAFYGPVAVSAMLVVGTVAVVLVRRKRSLVPI
jgi:hypothetical protein